MKVIYLINIALCDDMRVLRNDLERLIRTYEEEKNTRFKYFLFESGEELLEKFDTNKALADIYFLDYYMKGMNGVQTALHIRQFDAACNIVFVTSADLGNLYEFMQVSPLEILSKPAKKESVFNILDKVLAQKKRGED